MTFKLNDGTELDKPIRTDIHRNSFYKASEGQHVETVVGEHEYPAILCVYIVNVTEGWEHLGPEYLSAVVNHRVTEGWTILHGGDSYVTLRRLT